MSYPTTSARRLAILAGAGCTAGALAILCQDAITSGHWSLDHGLLPLVVGVTIAAGHLIGSAVRERRALSALGFAALFALGTCATVYHSVGRQAATAATADATATAHNGRLAQAQRALEQAETDARELAWLVDWHTAGKPRDKAGKPDMKGRASAEAGCGTICKGYGVRRAEATETIASLKAEIAGLGPQHAAQPKAARFAEVVALVGLDRAQTQRVAHILEPLVLTLFLELGAIVAFGFGFAPALRSISAPNRSSMPNASDSAQTSFPAAALDSPGFPDGSANGSGVATAQRPRSPNGSGGSRRSKDEAAADLVTLLAMGERFGSQDDLAERWGRPKSTVSEWLKQWEADGLIPSRTVRGRKKALVGA